MRIIHTVLSLKERVKYSLGMTFQILHLVYGSFNMIGVYAV